MTVSFPWPHSDLSPNARTHWRKLAIRRRAYRTGCGWECKAQGVAPVNADRLAVSITFCPPNARRRDLDNCLASIKSGLDALSDALGVDDSKWSIKAAMGDPVKFGRVFIEWTGESPIAVEAAE